MYNYIIPLIIFIIIGIVLYFRYNTKEGFQVDASSNSVNNGIDINNISIVTPDVGNISNMAPADAALHVNSVIKPLIAANPDLQGVIANDQVSILQVPATFKAPVNPSYTTTTDTRPITDISKQCDIINNQLNAILRTLDVYKRSHSWEQVRYALSSIDDLQKQLIKLDC